LSKTCIFTCKQRKLLTALTAFINSRIHHEMCCKVQAVKSPHPLFLSQSSGCVTFPKEIKQKNVLVFLLYVLLSSFFPVSLLFAKFPLLLASGNELSVSGNLHYPFLFSSNVTIEINTIQIYFITRG
jgi:hypothetical protein